MYKYVSYTVCAMSTVYKCYKVGEALYIFYTISPRVSFFTKKVVNLAKMVNAHKETFQSTISCLR